jgi:spermidine/putrescine-binding protein
MERSDYPIRSSEAGHTRRSVLQGALGATAALALPGLLAACGGSKGSATASSAGGGAEEVGGTLRYLGWQGEDFQELLAPWMRRNGVTIEPSFIDNMSGIAAKYAAGGGSEFDIINFSSNGTQRLLGSGVPFMPLDLERVPNFAGVQKFFQDNESLQNEDGEIVAIPTAWGALGVSYDSKAVSAPAAWGDLLEPEFKGKITVIDDPSTAFGLAAPILGYNGGEMTQDQFGEVRGYLEKVVAQAKKLTPSFGDMATLLASGEVIAAWGGYSSIDAFAAEAGNSDIRTQIELSDGSASFTECYAIPEDGQNAATAYAMIDALLEPKSNAAVANAMILAPTVDAAWPRVEPTIEQLFPKGTAAIESFLAKAPLVLDPPAQSTEFVNFGEITQAWTEIKAGAG